MAVTVETTAPCRKKLRVEVAPERVAGTRAEILSEFRKVANLPGFRPGKAPEPMVEKRYAAEIDEEVRKRLIPDSYREAVASQDLRVVGYPQIENVDYNPGKPMVYIATVDTAPEFQLPEYKGIELKKKEIVVADEEVQQMIDELRDQQADFVTVEGRGVRTGDFAVLNYSGVADGKPIAELIPEAKTLGENKDFWLLVESDAFVPGFCDQLLGAQAGEKRQVLVDFPADFPQKPIAGRKATYFVDVVAIKEKKLPEVTEEFAKKLGSESVDKLREAIRKDIAAERDGAARAELRNQVVEHLLGKVQFELPESLVAQETRSIIYDVVRENTMRGATKEQLEQRKDEIFGFATKSALDRLRASFILEEIARAERIQVAESEMDVRINEMAERHRTTPEKLRAQLAERDAFGDIEEQVRVGKTLDFLVANARVVPLTAQETERK